MRVLAAVACAAVALAAGAATALAIITSPQGRTVNATAGQQFTAVVATFDSFNSSASSFGATIDWGDQSSSAGTVTQNSSRSDPPNQRYAYDAGGTHTYAQPGDYSIVVTVTDTNGPTTQIQASAHVVAASGSPPPPPPPAQGTPPSAVLASETTSPTASVPIAIDASHSSDGSTPIVSYAFDLDGNGSYETECGGSPSAAVSYGTAGPVTVGLLVTDSAGSTSTTSLALTVSGKAPKKSGKGGAPGGLTLGYCRSPSAVGKPGTDLLTTAPCLKTVAARIAEAVTAGCFAESGEEPSVTRSFGAAPITSPVTEFAQHYYSTTSKLKLNGIDIKAKTGAIVVIHKEAARLYTRGGGANVSLDAGVVGLPAVPLKSGSISWSFPVKGSKLRIAEFDVAPAAGLFGFNIEGKAAVDLMDGSGGGPRAEVPIHIALPGVFSDPTTGKGLTADVTLKADNARKLYVDKLRVDLAQAFLGGVKITNLFFEYRADESIWRGGANLLLPSGSEIHASPPPDNYGIGFRNGGLDYLGGDFTFADPGLSVFTGVFLHRISLVVETHPTRFTGTVFLTAGSAAGKTLAAIDGAVLVAFATPSEPLMVREKKAEGLAIDVSGNLKLLGTVPLAEAHVTYLYPYYIEAAGKFEYHIIKNRLFAKATASGWVDMGSGKFNIEAGADLCIDIKVYSGCRGGSVVLSSRGMAGCVSLWFADVGGGIYWSGGGKIYFKSCDVGDFRATLSRAAADGSFGVDVSKDVPFEAIEVTGRDAAPSVDLTGPHGEKISTPDGGFLDSAQASIWRGSEDDKATWVLLPRSAAGHWTISAAAGSAIAQVRTAHGLPKPKVSGRVTGRGFQRTLAYDVAPLPGQTVSFVERGANTAHAIGPAQGRTGQIRFRLASGPAGPRTVVAVVESDGLVRKEIVVARFSAPKPPKPGRPGGLRVRRAGGDLALRWRRVAGADLYVVGVDVSDGRRLVFTSRSPALRIPAIPPRFGARIRVAGLSATNARGAIANASVPAAKATSPRTR
jgi:hypothetical protein